MREDTRSIALHNLHVTLKAAREAGEACRRRKLAELLAQQAKHSPRLAKALRELLSPRPCRGGA
jgi:queuine/archaeosine tRNA-ribosyltransferase